MEGVGLTFALMGFVFGLGALGQVVQLKNEVQRLRSQLEAD